MRIMMMSLSLGQENPPHEAVALHVLTLAEALHKLGHTLAILTGGAPGPSVRLKGIETTFSVTPIFPAVLNKVLQVDPFAYAAVRRILTAWRPDILHLHGFLSASLAPIVAAARLQIAVVATLHSYWPVCLRYAFCYNEDMTCRQRYVPEVCSPCLVRGLHERTGVRVPVRLMSPILRGAWAGRRRLLQGVRTFIAPSRAVAQSLRESGYPPERIVILPFGLPPSDFVAHARGASREPGGPHLLYVGQLVTRKGVPSLLEALLQVRQAYPQVTLTLAGDGARRPDFERLSTALDLAAATRFVGLQPRSRLSELYAQADVMVIPSLSEVLPFVGLEALFAGIPVVAAAVGGIPDIFGSAAILVPPMDSTALARGIVSVLSDPAAAEARARRAQEQAPERFGFDMMVDRIDALYAELLGTREDRGVARLVPQQGAER
jgi:glycosyltransferase involved in cell wall biosynthesis